MNRLLSQISLNAFSPIPITPFAYMRFFFGAIMLWEVWRYFHHNWVYTYYMRPTIYFSYYGMDWLRPLPGNGMITLFIGLGLLAFCIMIGLFYRLTMPLFFLGFTYVFLLDQSNYLNHFYLVALLSFLLVFIPAHRAFSLDSRLRPKIYATTAPAWMLWLVRFQITIVYFFGGIAKLNSDWLHGEPMRMWLAQRTDFPLIGQFFTEEWLVVAFSYGGIFIDLFAVPLLFIPRIRWLTMALLISFHLLNARLWNIGIFPWMMIALLPLFLPIAWWERITISRRLAHQQNIYANATTYPFSKKSQRLILIFLAIYCSFQLIFPLRHFFIPGHVSWTEEGEKFSWQMKLRDKHSIITYIIVQPSTGQSWEELPEDYLTPRQLNNLPENPDAVLQFAHYLATLWDDVEVYANVLVSLNGREYSRLIDPTINLAAEPRRWGGRSAWILPLTTPLNQRR
ncbi:MAG: HTTM domain-containing protein [Chitinophagaceae bacterium]|nr:HTTM domain-containing protein [Anaerolineae bacterium]